MDAIDLYSARFWGFVVVALIVLVPLTASAARKWVFAALNLGFLVLYTKPGGAVPTLAVIAGIALIWLALRGVGGRSGMVMLSAGGTASLGLFLLHKLPHVATRVGAGRFEGTLAAIGFSYVALRLIDVARAVRDGNHPPPDLASTINYLLPFHMLAAGPIQSYDDFASQPPIPPPLDAGRALKAFERIAWGLTKKFLLANFIDRAFLTGFHATGPYALLEMNLNYVWLFLDFSAYSDVAVGLGALLGVATPENFNRPFLARNQVEYWERWHISLSQFIRRNLFIPIQLALTRRTGGKRPLLVASVAFTVSFVLCGVWHSISLPWLAWGVLQSLGLVVCNLYRHFLVKRLGRKGVNAYLTRPMIRLAAIALTFEFNAFVVAVATYPYRELHWWTTYPG